MEHAGDLEQEDVQRGLHGDLHHEVALWRVLGISVRFVDFAGQLCVCRLHGRWQGQFVGGTFDAHRESVLVEAHIEVLHQVLARHVGDLKAEHDLLCVVDEEVPTNFQTSLAFLTRLRLIKSIVHLGLGEVER